MISTYTKAKQTTEAKCYRKINTKGDNQYKFMDDINTNCQISFNLRCCEKVFLLKLKLRASEMDVEKLLPKTKEYRRVK